VGFSERNRFEREEDFWAQPSSAVLAKVRQTEAEYEKFTTAYFKYQEKVKEVTKFLKDKTSEYEKQHGEIKSGL
jgi:hypothetical protein